MMAMADLRNSTKNTDPALCEDLLFSAVLAVHKGGEFMGGRIMRKGVTL